MDNIYYIIGTDYAGKCILLEKCGFETFFTGEGAYHDGVYEISKSVWKDPACSD